jgi:exodeoxyribonuclease VII large subunit
MTTSQKVFTISELTYAIKSHLEPYFHGISVQGEVSNFKQQSSGHLYFTLKDADAQLCCVLFKGNSFSLKRLPKDGDQIIAKGELSIYPPRGNYQFIIRELVFSGVGDLLLKLHALKEKLQALGWLDQKHKKALPKFPKTIGIVTSPTGAVIQDILHVLNRRFYNTQILLYPVKVQGDGSAEEIAKAIQEFNQYSLADVLIVGRGGGSLEDLWAFNEEIVAKAIFESKIPIISAVGHETDTSIADFVADLRAPTPSAAAELVIGERDKFLKDLSSYRREMTQHVVQRLQHFHSLLKSIEKQRVFSSSYALLSKEMQHLDDIKEKLDLQINHFLEKKRTLLQAMNNQTRSFNPLFQFKVAKEKLRRAKESLSLSFHSHFSISKKSFQTKNFVNELVRAFFQKIFREKERVGALKTLLISIDPKSLLKKGYSILFSEKEDSTILSVKTLKKNETFVALLSDGKMRATVEEILEKQ